MIHLSCIPGRNSVLHMLSNVNILMKRYTRKVQGARRTEHGKNLSPRSTPRSRKHWSGLKHGLRVLTQESNLCVYRVLCGEMFILEHGQRTTDDGQRITVNGQQ